MLLESLLLRGEQIKNVPLPMPLIPSLCSTNTNANRCSALSQRQHLLYSQIDNVKALLLFFVSLSPFDIVVVVVAALLNACAKWH